MEVLTVSGDHVHGAVGVALATAAVAAVRGAAAVVPELARPRRPTGLSVSAIGLVASIATVDRAVTSPGPRDEAVV